MDPAPSSREPFAAAEAEELLRTLPWSEVIGLLRHSTNYTYLARLEDPAHSLLAVYKPAAGESPLWDFTPESLYLREVAAYLLARQLGWPRIPPTVIREDGPRGVGSLQLFVDGDPRNHYLRVRDLVLDEWPRVALFDYLVNNADRKAGHCLLDAERRVWVFDHGLTFHALPKLRTIIWDFAGNPLPKDLKADVERVARDLEGPLGSELGRLLSRNELRALKRRFADVLSANWCFPYPTSNWSIPWPPI